MESAINTEHAVKLQVTDAYSLSMFGLLKKLALKGTRPIHKFH